MDKDGPETMREAVARAIAKGLGDEFDNAFVSKVGWTAAQGQRGGRFRDINEPYQSDYLDAADAAIRTVLERAAKAAWTAPPLPGHEPSKEYFDAFRYGRDCAYNAVKKLLDVPDGIPM